MGDIGRRATHLQVQKQRLRLLLHAVTGVQCRQSRWLVRPRHHTKALLERLVFALQRAAVVVLAVMEGARLGRTLVLTIHSLTV